MTSIPQNKQELYQAIKLAHENLISDYSNISVEYSRIIGVEGNVKGTEISVCDTIAYLIGWEKLVLKWYQRKSAGKPVDFPETGYRWNELGKLAQRFHSQYEEWSYQELLTEFNATTTDILGLVESLSNQELYGAEWYKHYTLGRMIQFNTSSPMKNIRVKIRKFYKTLIIA